MRLTFLGTESEEKDSPTLYATDRDSYLIQGYKVADPAILASIHLRPGETAVEIYARLMTHFAKHGHSGIVTRVQPPIVYVRDNGNYVLRGPRVTDSDALTTMQLPDNEDAIEVPRAAIVPLFEDRTPPLPAA